MASIVAAKHDGVGLSGIAYNAQIYSGKVLPDVGSSSPAAIAAGINWAVSKGVNIISMSFGGSGSCPSDIQTAITAATGQGIIAAVAAGNNDKQDQGYDAVTAPANCAGVLAISSYGLTPLIPP